MRPKKKESEKFANVQITLPPHVLAYLDKMAKEMKTTRSGFIVDMVLFQKALDDNKELNKLATAMIKRAMKP